MQMVWAQCCDMDRVIDFFTRLKNKIFFRAADPVTTDAPPAPPLSSAGEIPVPCPDLVRRNSFGPVIDLSTGDYVYSTSPEERAVFEHVFAPRPGPSRESTWLQPPLKTDDIGRAADSLDRGGTFGRAWSSGGRAKRKARRRTVFVDKGKAQAEQGG